MPYPTMSKLAVVAEIAGGLVCIFGMLLCAGIGQIGSPRFDGPISKFLADRWALAIFVGLCSIVGGIKLFVIGVMMYRRANLTNVKPEDQPQPRKIAKI